MCEITLKLILAFFGEGRIDSQEIMQSLRDLGVNISEDQADKILKRWDPADSPQSQTHSIDSQMCPDPVCECVYLWCITPFSFYNMSHYLTSFTCELIQRS